jgi:hypothetical protein
MLEEHLYAALVQDIVLGMPDPKGGFHPAHKVVRVTDPAEPLRLHHDFETGVS